MILAITCLFTERYIYLYENIDRTDILKADAKGH